MKFASLPSRPLGFAVAGLLGAAAVISTPGQALAANPIVLTGQMPDSINGTYTIGWITGTWASVGAQVTAASPWWGDTNRTGTLAAMLAGSQVFSGPPNALVPPMVTKTNSFTNFLSPNNVVNANVLFASSSSSSLGGIVNGSFWSPATNPSAPAFLVDQNTSLTWAVGSSVPDKVPAPLPLVGAVAAFGFSRRLRTRIAKSASA